MANNIKIKDLSDGLKGISFEQWGGLDGFLAATSVGGGGNRVQELRRVVPWLAKATDMTANAISALPFDIVNEAGDVVDTSTDWKNKVGGLKSPEILFYKLASSLCLGRAYVIPRATSKVIVDLQYCAPHTVEARIGANGVEWFDRVADTGKAERYYPADSKQSNIMLYFWLPDSDVELGPALSFPAGTALLSTNLLFSMDSTIQTYSERGFVPATLLSAKGMPSQSEREKAENWWNRWLRGWTKEAAKIVNSEAMTVNRIGAGLDELKGSYGELTKQAIENIGTAFGIPAALFMSDMAFASEVNPMIKVWYTTSSFVRIYKTIEQTFNDQLLNRWNYKLIFRPETIDAFQQEEVDRSAAFTSYVNAGIKPSIAAQMVGLELPVGIEYEDLDPEIPEVLEPFAGQNPPPNEEQQPLPIPEKEDEDEEEIPVKLNSVQIKELNLWRQIAERNERKGKGRAADFECKHLTKGMADRIRTRLASSLSIAEAFEVEGEQRGGYDSEALKALAEAINKAAEVELSKTKEKVPA
jgi:hypothetical protein